MISPGPVLQSLCSLGPAFRNILQGQDIEEIRETLNSLKVTVKLLCLDLASNLFQRQTWRLQDLSDGGGLGSSVELFLLALKQLLSTSLSRESESALYIGTFRAITSDWSVYKHCVGTQKILLDVAASSNGMVSIYPFPAFIRDEFLVLLGNVLDKQTGPHIDNAVHRLRGFTPVWSDGGIREFRAKVLDIILQSRIAVLASPSS